MEYSVHVDARKTALAAHHQHISDDPWFAQVLSHIFPGIAYIELDHEIDMYAYRQPGSQRQRHGAHEPPSPGL